MSSPADPAPTVDCDNLSVGYDNYTPVLKGFNCLLEGPGIIRVSGRNGTGKSTLVEAISGYLRPLDGGVLINGIPASNREARAHRKVCRETPALHPHLSVYDHLLLSSRMAQTPITEVTERAAAFELQQFERERVTALSLGNRRKLWYIMCTTRTTPIVVLDEPFNGVDTTSLETMVNEIIVESRHALVLLIAHSIPDRISVLKEVDVHGSMDTTDSLKTRRRY